MKIAEGIHVVQDFLAEKECAELIAWTETLGYEAAPITTNYGFEMRPDIRNNTRVIVDDVDRAAWLWERLRPHAPPVFAGRAAVGLNERFRFYRYDPGERFAPHRDGAFRRANGEQSRLTFMIYLNEGFDGGETNFDDASITPRTGLALMFDHDLHHEGAAVRSGRKYVLRSDVMYARV